MTNSLAARRLATVPNSRLVENDVIVDITTNQHLHVCRVDLSGNFVLVNFRVNGEGIARTVRMRASGASMVFVS